MPSKCLILLTFLMAACAETNHSQNVTDAKKESAVKAKTIGLNDPTSYCEHNDDGFYHCVAMDEHRALTFHCHHHDGGEMVCHLQ